MLAVITVSISGFIGAFPCSVHIYGLLRFITGMGGIGCYMVCFVLVVEHVGYKVTNFHQISNSCVPSSRC
jgi:hypothetical protein